MALYLAAAAELEALPVGTRYKVYSDRADLFGGKLVIACEAKLTLPAAPKTYPNGVDIVAGAQGEERTVAEKPLGKYDAAELSAAVAQLRATPEGEKQLAELVKPFLAVKAVQP